VKPALDLRVSLDRVTARARDIRAELLRVHETPRNLAGECGLAAMLMAAAIADPHALRTGFYMKRAKLLGTCGRYPHRHAWCRVGTMIVDATATQFDRSNKAVYVVRFDEDTRYIETASGGDAIDDIMTNWRGRELAAYVQIARGLRRSLRRAP
jgi:hypothetical protein